MALQIPEQYIIASVKNGVIFRYYSNGEHSAEWYDNIRYADRFQNAAEVDEVLLSLKSKESQVSAMSGGSKYPNTDLRGALGVSDTEPHAKIELVGIRFIGAVVISVDIEGRIQHPTGYTYD